MSIEKLQWDQPSQTIAYIAPSLLNDKDLDDACAFIKRYFPNESIEREVLEEYFLNLKLSLARDWQTKDIVGLICASDEPDIVLIRKFNNDLRALKWLLVNIDLYSEKTYDDLKEIIRPSKKLSKKKKPEEENGHI